MLNTLVRKVKRKLGIPLHYPSETSKVRHLVLEYCVGDGCDIGFGGDKIKKERCAGIDFPQPYAHTGKDKVDIGCDVIKDEIPVPDNTYDYVYTSHLIEDFADTRAGLRKFIRILKSNGTLILVFPDQVKYEAQCRKTGQPLNMYHVHADMGQDFMLAALDKIEGIRYSTLFASNCVIDYNVILVLKITKS
ncbi:methyltransferase domain-containing protein [Dinghuibacter silviterrae]|uniref:Methyltransferase family protein n=1 Tax=Dinghuibacter silviterrae TaxID=1539049 RepID=A0A4R8DG80_9BACT|nr:methyltransferase domain-containing protein [Dinghuibacter silviterrae]TDW96639.1 methyltransferase family protein [Dinghuibacter silviterrae]